MSRFECRRHEYQCDHWKWELEDGAVIIDVGLSERFFSTSPKSFRANHSVEVPKQFKVRDIDVDPETSREASWIILH